MSGAHGADRPGTTSGSADGSGHREPAAPINAAARDVYIGAQISTVRGDFVYQVPPDATAAMKYEAGVRHLEGGVPSRARALITEAFMGGHTGNEVQFHRLLALLSGRTLRQLSPEDQEELKSARVPIAGEPADAWTVGIEAINLIIAASEESSSKKLDDTRRRLDEIANDTRTKEQWSKVLRHLDLLHRGHLRNYIWARAAAQAHEDRFKNERRDRAWKFFQPEPAGPRVRRPDPPRILFRDSVRVAVATGLLLLCLLRTGQVLSEAGHTPTALLLLLILLGMYGALINGASWRAIIERKGALDLRYQTGEHHQLPPVGGFAEGVDHRFDHYFARYTPRNADREQWLRETAGIRRTLRDEIVETYREARVSDDQVAWLIRHRVGQVKHHWEAGELRVHRRDLRIPVQLKATTIACVTLIAICAWEILDTAVRTDTHSAVGWFLAAAALTYWAVQVWLPILSEHRRHEYDCAESEQRLADSTAAYERWLEKLRDTPTDTEMAVWLDADRQVLLQTILQHYHLSATDLITQASIEAPGDRARHARVLNGPWRYTRYQMLVFLLTADGVRQFRSNLEFVPGDFYATGRSNYRYDSVGSVHVHISAQESTFELSLTDGQRLQIPVITGGEELQAQETVGAVTKVTLEAAGIDQTLHLLEGIAAEGRNWIDLQEQRIERQLSVPLAIPGETVTDLRALEGEPSGPHGPGSPS